jgi:hypothetical protein
MQAAYHKCAKNLHTHSEGVVILFTTGFTVLRVEISSCTNFFPLPEYRHAGELARPGNETGLINEEKAETG